MIYTLGDFVYNLKKEVEGNPEYNNLDMQSYLSKQIIHECLPKNEGIVDLPSKSQGKGKQ